RGAETAEKDWYSAPLTELVEHIVSTHHVYVKQALPRLRSLITKVLNAHGEHHGEMLRRVQGHFSALDNELTSHMMKEERMLFPYIVNLERHSREGTPKPVAPFGSVQNPVRQMESEHESAGGALVGLRQATGNFVLPGDACPTFRAMYEELQRFEADLHQHIHLENNILFPRAIAMEGA
ncbi:MAG: hemerythrin domain-containing protein, partial [Thermoguttaceae bacterium]